MQDSPPAEHSFTSMLLVPPCSTQAGVTPETPRKVVSLGWLFPPLPRPTLVVEMECARPSRWWEALEPQGCLVGGAADDLAPQQDRLVG